MKKPFARAVLLAVFLAQWGAQSFAQGAVPAEPVKVLELDLGSSSDSWVVSKGRYLLGATWSQGAAGRDWPDSLKSWDLESGELKSDLSGLSYLTLSASGRTLLASERSTGDVRAFSVDVAGALQPLFSIGKLELEEFNGYYRNLPQFSPDDQYLAVFEKNGELRIFDLGTQSVAYRLASAAGGKFSPDSKHFLVSTKQGSGLCELQVLNIATRTTTPKSPVHPWICGPRFEDMAAFAPDSRSYFETELLAQNEYGEETRRVFARYSDTGRVVNEVRLQSENGRKYKVTFSPDAAYLAVSFSTICAASDYDCFQKGTLIRIEDGARLEGTLGDFAHLQFSKDGRFAIARNFNETEKMVNVSAWDLRTMAKVAEYRQHPSWFVNQRQRELPQWVSVPFDPRMTVLPHCLGGAWDGDSCYLDVLDLITGAKLFQTPISGTLRYFAVSPDSRFAVVDKNLFLLDARFRVIPLVTTTHRDLLEDEKTELRFTPRSRFLRVLGPKGLSLVSLTDFVVALNLTAEQIGGDRHALTVRRSDDELLIVHGLEKDRHSETVRVYRLP